MLAAVLIWVTVQSGQTESGIAASHGASLAAVETANIATNPNPDVIIAGQRLAVPVGGSYAPAPSTDGDGDHDGDTGGTTRQMSGEPTATPAPSYGSPSSGGGIPGWASCIVGRESGGNASAVNGSSGAGGLFQDLPSTWNGYGGYPTAESAPVGVQIAFNNALSGNGSNLSPWAADGCPGT